LPQTINDPWQTPSLANTWKIAHAGEEQVALIGSFKVALALVH
jgi:hypothetical protein